MPRKRELAPWHEDSDAGVPGGGGREREDRLREVDLAGQWLQARLRNLARVREDGELIAGQGPVREDIADDITVCAHRLITSTQTEPGSTISGSLPDLGVPETAGQVIV